MKRFWALLKRHAEIVFIGLAVVLFLAGVASFFLRRAGEPEASPGGRDARGAIGPSPGEPIPAYIEARKVNLSQQADKDPRGTSFAVMSFTGYLKGGQVDSLLAHHKLRAVEAQWRLPLEGSKPQAAGVAASVGAAMAGALETAIAQLSEEATQFDNYANEAALPEERTQFAEDAKRVRQLIDALKADPALIYAVVVRGSNAALAETAKFPEVRLVDLGDQGEQPGTHRFTGLTPEQTEVA